MKLVQILILTSDLFTQSLVICSFVISGYFPLDLLSSFIQVDAFIVFRIARSLLSVDVTQLAEISATFHDVGIFKSQAYYFPCSSADDVKTKCNLIFQF